MDAPWLLLGRPQRRLGSCSITNLLGRFVLGMIRRVARRCSIIFPRLRGGRWVSVGRLDLNTSGLLVFTTDGELAHQLMHPSSGIEREYRCRVRGNPGERELKRLLAGITLGGQLCRFESVEAGRGSGREPLVSRDP